MGLKRLKTIAYSLKFSEGFCMGLYILTYLVALGDLGARQFPISSAAFGLLALAFCFLIEYFLEIWCGAEADIKGSKATFTRSFILRGVFPLFLLLTMRLFHHSPLLIVIGTILTMSSYALAFTLFSGNFEQFLMELCKDKENANQTFALSQSLFFLGTLLGASIALLVHPSTAFFAAAMSSFIGALICLALPTQEKRSKKKTTLQGHQEAIQQATVDFQKNPSLNHAFWIHAYMYGIVQTVNSIIPIVYLSVFFQKNTTTIIEKFLILVIGMWLPSVLGSLSLLPKVRLRNNHPISQMMTSVVYMLCFWCLILPFTFFTSDLLNSILIVITIAMIRISYGRQVPLFNRFNAEIANEVSAVPKTVLSIGERRKKLASIIILVLPAIGGYIFETTSGKMNESIYYIIIATCAVCILVYTQQTLGKLSSKDHTSRSFLT